MRYDMIAGTLTVVRGQGVPPPRLYHLAEDSGEMKDLVQQLRPLSRPRRFRPTAPCAGEPVTVPRGIREKAVAPLLPGDYRCRSPK